MTLYALTTYLHGRRKRGVDASPCQPDMSVDPKVGYMIQEDLSTKYSIGSMIQSDPIVKFDSRSWIPLDPSVVVIWDWILDPIGSLVELVLSDL